MKGVTRIIIDPLYGNSGKGKIAALVARSENAALAVEVGTGPSAGHEIWDAAGRRYLTRMVPPCFIHRTTKLAIAKGVMIEPALLRTELQQLAGFEVENRLFIDNRCRVVDLRSNSDLVRAETEIRRTRAHETLPRVSQVAELSPFMANVDDLLSNALRSGQQVVVVMQHGTCVTNGFGEGELIEWTCTTESALRELPGIGAHQVSLVVRTMPTRTQDGPLPNEIAWPQHMPQVFGMSSGRPMRISSGPDMDLLQEMAIINHANEVYLTFADFLDSGARGVTRWQLIPDKIKKFVSEVERRIGLVVRYISTGPAIDEGVWLPVNAAEIGA
jgi:adenylosuccinate synthase